MEMNEKRPDPMHSIVDIDGFIANGKQFDLDITLANDRRDVIYGIVKDCFKEPVKDAVVKLVEVEYKYGKKEIKPVSHTFTDKEGEFVFGPLCPDKKYAIQIWKDDVRHIKICARTRVDAKCLKGVDIDCERKDDCKKDYKDDYKDEYKEEYYDDHKDDYKKDDKCDCKKDHKDDYKDEHKKDDECDCQKEHKDDYRPYDKKCDKDCDKCKDEYKNYPCR